MKKKEATPKANLPTQAELALLAAAIQEMDDPRRKVQRAIQLWQAAGEFLSHEPYRARMRRAQHLRSIRRINAATKKQAEVEAERAKDPHRLLGIATGGKVFAADFLLHMLPDEEQKDDGSPEGADNKVRVYAEEAAFTPGSLGPDEPEKEDDNSSKPLPPWTAPRRKKMLEWFMRGKKARYSEEGNSSLDEWAALNPGKELTTEDLVELLAREKGPEWEPRYEDGEKLLDEFWNSGLVVEQVMGFADEFSDFAFGNRPVMNRDLSMLAVKAKRDKAGAANPQEGECPACGHRLRNGKCDCAFREETGHAVIRKKRKPQE
ncbi:hypothetical protein [Luteolibacter sp. Populi]|uniref:hypothetical protein n=1 Tax=Luteolibacter sp. Populi TaxID=3230487 RepID=UPI00346635D6